MPTTATQRRTADRSVSAVARLSGLELDHVALGLALLHFKDGASIDGLPSRQSLGRLGSDDPARRIRSEDGPSCWIVLGKRSSFDELVLVQQHEPHEKGVEGDKIH